MLESAQSMLEMLPKDQRPIMEKEITDSKNRIAALTAALKAATDVRSVLRLADQTTGSSSASVDNASTFFFSWLYFFLCGRRAKSRRRLAIKPQKDKRLGRRAKRIYQPPLRRWRQTPRPNLLDLRRPPAPRRKLRHRLGPWAARQPDHLHRHRLLGSVLVLEVALLLTDQLLVFSPIIASFHVPPHRHRQCQSRARPSQTLQDELTKAPRVTDRARLRPSGNQSTTRLSDLRQVQ